MKPRSVNMNADSGEKTWLTPRHIIDALGPFDTDPCCPDGGMPWPTARRMITKTEDGLKQEWTGRVWLNPPYGREAFPFLSRMASYTGGVLHLCSSVQTLANGMNGYCQLRTQYCSSVGDSASAMRWVNPRSHVLCRPRLSHTPLRTHSCLSKAVSRERL